MARSRLYEIAHIGLKVGIHEYEYTLDERFLKDMDYDGEYISGIAVAVRVTFEKNENFFQIKFDYDGKINMLCDRCGDALQIIIWEEYKLIIKLTSNEHELDSESVDDDVVFMPRTEAIIHLDDYLYEYFLLSIPMQKVHGVDENRKSLCNPEAIKLLTQYERNFEEQKATNIWNKLSQNNN